MPLEKAGIHLSVSTCQLSLKQQGSLGWQSVEEKDNSEIKTGEGNEKHSTVPKNNYSNALFTNIKRKLWWAMIAYILKGHDTEKHTKT